MHVSLLQPAVAVHRPRQHSPARAHCRCSSTCERKVFKHARPLDSAASDYSPPPMPAQHRQRLWPQERGCRTARAAPRLPGPSAAALNLQRPARHAPANPTTHAASAATCGSGALYSDSYMGCGCNLSPANVFMHLFTVNRGIVELSLSQRVTGIKIYGTAVYAYCMMLCRTASSSRRSRASSQARKPGMGESVARRCTPGNSACSRCATCRMPARVGRQSGDLMGHSLGPGRRCRTPCHGDALLYHMQSPTNI